MRRALWIVLATPVAGLAAFYTILTAYSRRMLPDTGPVSLDGITTLDDAARACHATGKTGWGLVAHAQQLTARKMAYSRRNPWDTPTRAFARSYGYCIQKAYALLALYRKLGIEAWPVQAYRNQFSAGEVHGLPEPARVSGHVWLRVRVAGEVRDVCPGRETNTPGVLHFEPLSEVQRIGPIFAILAHLGAVGVNFVRDVQALRRARRLSVETRHDVSPQ